MLSISKPKKDGLQQQKSTYYISPASPAQKSVFHVYSEMFSSFWCFMQTQSFEVLQHENCMEMDTVYK